MNAVDIDNIKHFKDAHANMFFEALLVAIANNTDSYCLTVNNVIANESNKLLMNLLKIYEQHEIVIAEDELKELVDENKEILGNTMKSLIEERGLDRKNYLEKDRKKDINEDYMQKYRSYICNSDEFLDKVDLETKKQICTVFHPKLTKTYTCKDEEMSNQIEKLINMNFQAIIYSRNKGECSYRDQTLCNISDDAYNIYTNLNENTPIVDMTENIATLDSKSNEVLPKQKTIDAGLSKAS